MKRANAEDVKRLALIIKDNWTLCEFLGKCEAEYMVAETIHAAAINLDKQGEAFSFKGANIRSVSVGRLVDNNAGFQLLLDRGLIVEDTRKGRDVLFPTQLLIELLDHFLTKEKKK